MSSTINFTSFPNLAAVVQPGSSPLPVNRNIILNMTSGGIENFSGNSGGLGTILSAGVIALNGTSNGSATSITVTNTFNSDGTLSPYAGAVRFTNNSTNNVLATAQVVSTV